MLRRYGPSRSRHRSRGQSLAEFALVFPVLMIVVGGIIQFGILFWGLNSLNQVVRDTGRWAATQQAACSPPPGPQAAVIATANSIAANSSLIGFSGSFPPGNVVVTWTGTPCPPINNTTDAWVDVTITHVVPVFFPFVSGQISSSTEFRMEPKPS
jgi:Flp pilus assembly protein TadG